jgi:hypothetical protein
MNTIKVKFEHFLRKFPEVKLPVTLRDDSHHDFSNENEPLSDEMVEDYIARYEAVEPDEFTEYVACFSLNVLKDISIIVYWKAGLLTYDYVMATYDKTGKMIDKRAIAGTKVLGNSVKRTIATISENLTIFMAEGTSEKEDAYEADSTKVFHFEVMENGKIEQDY